MRVASLQGLAAFARRVAYANASNDRTVPFWTAFIAPWRHGAPTPPPAPRKRKRGNSGNGGGAASLDADTDADPYPHIEWEGDTCEGANGTNGAGNGANSSEDDAAADGGAAGDAGGAGDAPLPEDASPSLLAGALALSGPLASPPARAAEAASDALSRGQYARIALCLPIGFFVLLPLWLTIVPSLLLPMGLYKRRTLRAPPLPPRLAALAPTHEGEEEEECSWPEALRHERGALAAPQAWMARQLNALPWHKVSVRFSLARDGITAVHTHGHIIVRRASQPAGMDVLRHLADTMLHTEGA
jgi:hypothetical protein